MDTAALQARIDSLQNQVQDCQSQIQSLRSDYDYHAHNGDTQRIQLFDIFGLFETVSVAPTGIPTNPYDQIKIYKNSTIYRLYWWEGITSVWHYVTATA